jgi:23S rRNA (adenine2503-C2)-methyltransferase
MPINKKWNIDSLLDACRRYYSTTGRRISFEYTLISGKNDAPDAALELARLLNKKLRASKADNFPIHVNLIPVNPVNETEFSASDKQAVTRFASVLEKNGIRATVRRKLGSDINASCGQLRREEEKKS